MPGSNQGASRGQSLTVEYLDTGAISEFNQSEIKTAAYGYVLCKKNWESLEVKDSMFFKQQPVCGFVTQESSGNKILVFGGQGTTVFSFAPQDTSKGQISIKKEKGGFSERVSLCSG